MATRRIFLKTLLGALASFYCFNSFLSEVDEKRDVVQRHLKPLSAAKITGVKAAQISDQVINKPFVNALKYLETPTYDRSGQGVHPSVIDFKSEYGLEKWGGFRYWMAFTPYPYFNCTFENPSLLVSKDGLNWINPPGIKNPLAPKPFGLLSFLSRNYNSDPELVYDPEQNSLILYWREYNEGIFEKIWAKRISSNIRLGDKILCFEKTWDYKRTGLVLSPTVWRKSSQEWYMWTTDGKLAVNLHTSRDGIAWSSGLPCSTPWDTWHGGYLPWHIAAKANHAKQKIEFLIAGWPIHGTMKDCQLLYATAPMSQPDRLTMPLQGPLLVSGPKNSWDNGYIYRSSFVLENEDKVHIWYSACSKKNAWHIGYTEGTLTDAKSRTLQT